MKSIKDIQIAFEAASQDERPLLIEEFKKDERQGVQKLVEKYVKKQRAYEEELTRLDGMLKYERQYEEYNRICGVDEAGRGPLAGPVVAGAVILPRELKIMYLNDSKQLSPKLRECLYDEIMDKAAAVGVGVVSPECIDEMNILQATYKAMRMALDDLGAHPDVLFNDAVIIPQVDIPQVKIIKGDSKSLSIAAASVIAKVTRDRMMEAYDQIFPEYGFAKHKGYGTKDHVEAIKKYGPSPIHRATFLKNFI